VVVCHILSRLVQARELNGKVDGPARAEAWGDPSISAVPAPDANLPEGARKRRPRESTSGVRSANTTTVLKL
jgi:hypothetical protein